MNNPGCYMCQYGCTACDSNPCSFTSSGCSIKHLKHGNCTTCGKHDYDMMYTCEYGLFCDDYCFLRFEKKTRYRNVEDDICTKFSKH